MGEIKQNWLEMLFCRQAMVNMQIGVNLLVWAAILLQTMIKFYLL